MKEYELVTPDLAKRVQLNGGSHSVDEMVMPICPICKMIMWVEKFEGYYDTFKHWQCGCHSDDLPKERSTSYGAYDCG